MRLGKKDYLLLIIILMITLAIGLLNENTLRSILSYGFILIIPALLAGIFVSLFFPTEKLGEDFKHPME
jgi:Na+/proline symporter